MQRSLKVLLCSLVLLLIPVASIAPTVEMPTQSSPWTSVIQITAYEVLPLTQEELIQAEIVSPQRIASISRGEEQRSLAVSSEDYELLAKIIFAEARGESFEGKVAVGAVVINRVQSDRFHEKTIKDIILAPGQFSPVQNGKLNVVPTEECYAAARAALQGEDPTEGSLFFCNPATATSEWSKSKPVRVVIGHHTFSNT